jgi:hypothetical protein
LSALSLGSSLVRAPEREDEDEEEEEMLGIYLLNYIVKLVKFYVGNFYIFFKSYTLGRYSNNIPTI